MEKYYETYHKSKVTGNWCFHGWYPQLNEDFCIGTKTRGRYTYKTYKWLNGEIDEYRYGEYVEKEN